MNYCKVTKLNLEVLAYEKNKDAFGAFGKAFGISEAAMESVPLEEPVNLNMDRVIGFSDPVPTGMDDGSMCVKVYFGQKDYWAIKVDEHYHMLVRTIEQ